MTFIQLLRIIFQKKIEPVFLVKFGHKKNSPITKNELSLNNKSD